MSLLTALNSGTSGLQSSSLELSVVGDNISNANTIGFKAGRANFEDALSQSVIGGSGQIGLGSNLQSVQRLLEQGSLSTTGGATDLALQGSGFFVVNGSHNGQTGSFYTRAGQFTLDQDGYLVNQEGLRVQGFMASVTGVISGAPSDLLVGNASALPNATGTVTVKGNLSANAAIPPLWDPTLPSDTSNFTTSTTVYDTLGNAHQAQVFFRNNGAGQWEWHAMVDGGELTGGTAGQLTEIAGGTLQYDTEGRLIAETQASDFNPIGAVNPQPLVFNFGTPFIAGGTGTGLDGITQFAGNSATTFIGQDGFASGQLTSLKIDPQGIINGVFTNGQTRVLGQVAVAGFPAPDQLERVGGNLYGLTPTSGQPVIGAPGDGGRASIASGALEQSNVDIAEQFVRMISAQRVFEANSKTITTADQLLSELIAMKR
jgi:flagellar hook protein FlgE